jgi:hypothetical protein
MIRQTASVLCALIFTLTQCASNPHDKYKEMSDKELADTTVWNENSQKELLIQDNRKVGRILGLDTILCTHVAPRDGIVYFDDPLWDNLSADTRRNLVECLDLKRGIRVVAPKNLPKDEKLWTARLSQDERRLLFGFVLNNCITCALHEGIIEYRIERKDSLFIPKRIDETEMWR